MFILNHPTKLGNSFNLAFVQEVLLKVTGRPSIHPAGGNFRNLFESPTELGFTGNGSWERHLKDLTLFERSLVHALVSGKIGCDEIEREFGERYDGEGLAILSLRSATSTVIDDLPQKAVIILNRAHHFAFQDMPQLKKRFQESFRSRLSLRQDIAGVRAQIAAARDNGPVYAIHLRKTDYQTYQDGRFFYSDEQYADVARHLATFIPDLQFFIFSDEVIDAAAFADIPHLVVSGTAEEDIVSMAACDAVIGPPSSYGNCASFLGKAKRFIIRDPSAFKNRFCSEEVIRSQAWHPYAA